YLGVQLAVGDLLVDRRIVAFPQDRGLIAAFRQVPVDAVDAGVQDAVLVPADAHVVVVAALLDPRREPDPVEALGLLAPEAFRIVERAPIHLLVFGEVTMRCSRQRFGHGEDLGLGRGRLGRGKNLGSGHSLLRKPLVRIACDRHEPPTETSVTGWTMSLLGPTISR